ncbi:MAG: YHS domain-containing (seleno)protein [Bdellovibrionales bacterium]
MKAILSLVVFLPSIAFSKADLINDKKGVALAGYDLVAYFKNAEKGLEEGLKGSKEYRVKHEGVDYHFSSEENKKLFIDSPAKYLPAYGGWCAWAVAQGKSEVSVDYNTFIVKKDESGTLRLYLFYNSWGINTLKKWQKKSTGAHEDLVRAADKVWAKEKTK